MVNQPRSAIIRRMEVLLIAAVVGIPLLIALVVTLRRAAANTERTLETAWADFARSRKLLFHQADPRVFSAQSIRITGSVDGVEIVIETIRKHDGDGTRSFTRLTAKPAEPLAFDGQIYNELPIAVLARALGAQDVETGDAAFDERFTVKASNELAMREHLTTEVRAALLAAESPVYVRFEDGAVSYDRRGHEKDPQKLAGAMDLAMLLSRQTSDQTTGQTSGSPPEREEPPARRPSRRRRQEQE